MKIIPVVPDAFHRRRGGTRVVRDAGDEREARPGKDVARHHLGGPCRGGRFAHAQVVRPDEELDLHNAPPGVRLCLGRDAKVLPDGNSVCRLRRDDADSGLLAGGRGQPRQAQEAQPDCARQLKGRGGHGGYGELVRARVPNASAKPAMCRIGVQSRVPEH